MPSLHLSIEEFGVDATVTCDDGNTTSIEDAAEAFVRNQDTETIDAFLREGSVIVRATVDGGAAFDVEVSVEATIDVWATVAEPVAQVNGGGK